MGCDGLECQWCCFKTVWILEPKRVEGEGMEACDHLHGGLSHPCYPGTLIRNQRDGALINVCI